MIQNILLNGCAPTPLAHYLKALGILRLVAEQKDPDATGCWRNEGFVLNSVLDEEALLQFFLEEYRPTPIIAPWNGGSGFYYQESKSKAIDPATGKKQKKAAFAASLPKRLAPSKLCSTAKRRVLPNIANCSNNPGKC